LRYIKFLVGWLVWRLRAGVWYAALGFRLYFAIGLDRDFNPGDDNVAKEFKYPVEKNYRKYLEKPSASS